MSTYIFEASFLQNTFELLFDFTACFISNKNITTIIGRMFPKLIKQSGFTWLRPWMASQNPFNMENKKIPKNIYLINSSENPNLLPST